MASCRLRASRKASKKLATTPSRGIEDGQFHAVSYALCTHDALEAFFDKAESVINPDVNLGMSGGASIETLLDKSLGPQGTGLKKYVLVKEQREAY